MNGKTHKLLGATIALAISQQTGDPSLLVIPSAMLGSVMPDIDLPESKMGYKHPFLSKSINKLFRHRTLTHSILGILSWVVLFTGLFALINYLYTPFQNSQFGSTFVMLSAYFIIGYISHIIADMFTVKGVALFYPFKMFIGFKLFKSGGNIEKLIFAGSFITILLLIF